MATLSFAFQVSISAVNSCMWIYLHICLLLWTSCYNTSVTCNGDSQVIGSSLPVLAIVGDDVILPCHIEPSVNVAKGTVEWTRPDLKPEYVLVLQHGVVQPDSVLNALYRERTSLFHEKLPAGNVSLKLSRVQLSDKGKFKCSVPTLHSSSLIQLVVGAVAQPVISVVGSSLSCDSGCWNPQPEVSWLDSEGNNLPAESSVADTPSQHCYAVQSNVTVRAAGRVTCTVHLPRFNRTVETHYDITVKESGLTAGGIAGIVIIVIIILLASILGYFYWNKQKQTGKDNIGLEGMPLNEVSPDDDEIRIVMVGKTGAGKSASGNTILGSKVFKSMFSAESQTKSCKKVSREVGGRKVSVIDTPGFFDTRFSEHKNLTEIRKCISRAAPGPHAFLAVIQLGRFTDEDGRSLENTQEAFGQKSNEYTMILFTRGDQLEGSVEDFVNGSQKLQELISEYSGLYHVFNNKTEDPSQVTELLDKINEMVKKNGGSYYTNEMFQAAKKQGLLKEVKEHEEQYELNSKPRGLCLIILNGRDDGVLVRRTKFKDAEKVKVFFRNQDFRVLMCKDQTASQMKKTLECISSLKNITELQECNVQEWATGDIFTDLEEPLQHTDAFVCYIYGGARGFYGTDEEEIMYLSIKAITTPFNVENCPDLKNKPKVFLLDTGLEEEDLPEEHSMEEDFLVAIANKEDYVANVDLNGSFFAQSVVRQLSEGNLRGDEIQIVLNNVIKEVSQKLTPRGTQQIPGVINTLKKNLVFRRC